MATSIPEEAAAADPVGTRDGRARVFLCGPLVVELDGRRVEEDLPGRQGRVVLSYLVANRGRPVTRDELVDVLWPEDQPAAPETSLRPLLTRLRHAVGDQRLVGRAQLALDLGADPWIDVEVAQGAAARAEAALDGGQAAGALRGAQEALAIVERPFLPDVLLPWADDRRQELKDLEGPLLEVAGRAALALGPSQRGEAERLARRLVEREPYRESGHALLMEVLGRQGNVVEALRVFDGLRVRLREELGVSPAPALTALHERLLHQQHGDVASGEPDGGTRAAPPLPGPLAAAAGGGFVGRAEALAALDGAWRRALEGSEQLAFVAGEPGVGKTRLVAHLAAELSATGATVLYGRCDEEALMPYQPVAEALRHGVRHGGPLNLSPELREELARLVPEVTDDDDGAAAPAPEALLGERDTQRYRLFEAVATALGGLAGDRGLMLVVDDVHWADRTTLLLLRFLTRIDGPTRVLLVVTYRDDEVGPGHPLTDLLADLRRDRRFERIALEGLDEEETGALVSARVPAATTPEFLRRLQAHTAGNPFFIEETLRGLDARADERLEEDALVLRRVPDGVGDVIIRRLGSVGEDVRAVLGMAAVIGREFDLAVLAAALERSEEDVLSALEDALAARLVVELPERVDRFAFCHALVRETLYDRQAASRRLRRHLRVGQALERMDGPRRPAGAELARHFVEARALAGNERAHAHLLRAADEAAEKLAYEDAARFLTQALDLLAEAPQSARDPQRCEVLLALGRVLWRAGDPTARERFAEAAQLARAADLAEPLARGVLGMTGRFYDAGVADRETIVLVEEALDRLGDADSSLRARLLARLADSLHVAGDEERRSELSAEAVTMARRLRDPDTLAVALMARHAALLHVAHLDQRLVIADELLDIARGRGRSELVAIGLHWRIYDHLEAGDGPAARRDEAELAAVAADLRQPLYHYLDRCWQGVWAQLDGRLGAAEEIITEAYGLGTRAGARTAGSTLLGALVTVRRDQGRLGELVDLVRGTVAEHPEITTWRGILPLVLVEGGLPDEGRAALDAVGDVGRLPRDLYWLTTVTVVAEAAAEVGSDAQREELYTLLAPYAHRCVPASLATCWGSASRVLGRLALALGRAEDAERHLEDALSANAALGARGALLRTRRDLAAVLREHGDAERADGLLASAREEADALDLAALAS